jgi:hypothetical protein
LNPQAATPTAWGFGFNMEDYNGDLFVSATGANVSTLQAGAIYRYDGTTSALKLTIPNPEPQTFAEFGRSLATNAGQLLVGASGRNIGSATSAGAAYLFNPDTGALLRTFLNPEPQSNVDFGDSVALVGNYAIIAAPGNSPSPGHFPFATGAAYVFDTITGAFISKIASPSPGQNERFTTGDGNALKAVGGLLAAGHAFNTGNVGTVYLFAIPEPTSVLLVFAAFGLAAFLRRI